MKILRPTRLLCLFLSGFLICLGMTSLPMGKSAQAQTYLVIEKPGKVKNFKLKPGSTLHYMMAGQKRFNTGIISRLTDSVIFMNEGPRLSIQDVIAIRKDQEMARIMKSFTGIAGIGYLSLDVFNNLINKVGPVFNQKTMMISGALIVSSLIFHKLSTRTLHMGKPWRLRVIDMANPPLINK